MVQGIKDTKHDTKCEKKNCLGIYKNGVSVSDCRFSKGLNDFECAAVGETEDFIKQEVILRLLCLLHMCIHLVWYHDSLHLMLKFHPCLIMVEDLLS